MAKTSGTVPCPSQGCVEAQEEDVRSQIQERNGSIATKLIDVSAETHLKSGCTLCWCTGWQCAVAISPWLF